MSNFDKEIEAIYPNYPKQLEKIYLESQEDFDNFPESDNVADINDKVDSTAMLHSLKQYWAERKNFAKRAKKSGDFYALNGDIEHDDRYYDYRIINLIKEKTEKNIAGKVIYYRKKDNKKPALIVLFHNKLEECIFTYFKFIK